MPEVNFNIIERHEIDDSKWNKCVTSSSNLIYGLSWYLDVSADNWKGLVFGDYEAVFPLTHRRKYKIAYLYQPFFTQQLGLFCTNAANYKTYYNAAIPFLKKQYKHISIQLNHYSTTYSEVNTAPNFELTLNASIDELRKQYNSQTKRNLKKAQKADLVVVDNLLSHDVIELFKNSKGKEVEEVKRKDYDRFELICQAVSSQGKIRCLSVLKSGQLIAGAIFFYSSNRFSMVMLASNEEAKQTAASTLLIDHMIEQYAGSDHVFDFEGSRIPSLARFYKGFGAQNNPYGIFRYSLIPFKN